MLNLVTDRTQADYAYFQSLRARGWDDLTEDERGYYLYGTPTPLTCLDGPLYCLDGPLYCRDNIVRGEYRRPDLNRVSAAVAYLACLLNGYGYQVAVTAKQDWADGQRPTVEQMAAYRADIAAIRAALTMPAGTPAAPGSMTGLTVTRANDIERILKTIDAEIASLESVFCRSGADIAGLNFYFAN
jgi:hypothetical protein